MLKDSSLNIVGESLPVMILLTDDNSGMVIVLSMQLNKIPTVDRQHCSILLHSKG